MLVLSRKKGESIIIGKDTELTIVDIDGDSVRIGVQAPAEIDIFRKEIYLSIQKSNQEASQNKVDIRELSDIYRKRKKEDGI